MRNLLLCAVTVATLTLGSIAFAAPKVLTSSQLDGVAAGQGVMDWFLPGPTTSGTSRVTPSNGTSTAEGADDTIVVDGAEGSAHHVAGAVAETDGIATAGDDNIAVDQDGNIAAGIAAAGTGNTVKILDQSGTDAALATGDNANIDVTYNEIEADVEYGSAAIAGDNNQVNINYNELDIDGDIERGGYGVIAGEATVTDSFNTSIVENHIRVDIRDSFNVTTNTLDISGQMEVSAIVLANTLGEQMVGVNLNVTSATATLADVTDEVPLGPASATANTHIVQFVINSSTLGGNLTGLTSAF